MRLKVTAWLLLLGSMAAAAMPAAYPAFAQTSPPADTVEHAAAAFDKGDATGARAELDRILAREPGNVNALFQSARVDFLLGHAEPARTRLEQVVKRAGNFASAWELMAQIAQEQGDLERRDEAIERLKLAIGSAIDPAIRRMGGFVREVIRVGDRRMGVLDLFVHGGTDFTRYQFSMIGSGPASGAFLVLRTDSVTTETWAANSMLPPDTLLFHLDMVDKAADGPERVAVYEYYVSEPNYDVVRATALKALRGEMQPLSGQPGSLAGILKK